MSIRLQERLERMRGRVAIRAWEYRQRDHAKGLWFRLRRVLAGADRAYAVSSEEGQALVAEGHPVAAVGGELHPPKLIVTVPLRRLDTLASKRPLPVRLSAELLSAHCIALVPFEVRGDVP